MEFISREKKEERLAKWHGWFAWHPVKTIEGKVLWFVRMKRRCTGWSGGDSWSGINDTRDWEYSYQDDQQNHINS